MKLKTPEIEFVKFDTEDIITTSSHNVDETTVGVIYLSIDSILNFNNMYKNDYNLGYDSTKKYSGFSGVLSEQHAIYPPTGEEFTYYDFGYAISCDVLNDEQKKALRVVDPNDVNDYNEVLAWLNSHGSAQ